MDPQPVELDLCQPVEEEGGSSEVVPVGPVPRTGSDQRRAQMASHLSLNRRLRIRACFAGTCGVTDEAPMECLTCDSRLHGVSCAEITRGFASVGCFTCPRCRLARMAPDLIGPAPSPW